jgi:uncharacterized protein YcbK (DUF882 family)
MICTRSPRTLAATCLAAVLGWTLLLPCAAAAERDHVVRAGQSLSRIAHRHGVTVASLAAANGLRRSSVVRPGQVLTVPEPGVIYVRPGQTLARIARNHEVPVTELARANRLKATAMLRVGQRLVLPGFEHDKEREKAERRWGKPRRPGFATLYRVWSKERRRVRLRYSNGRVSAKAVKTLRWLLRPKAAPRRRKAPDRRLLALLAEVSDHFGGRQIHVISGYRLPGGDTKPTSRHVSGDAIDFRIPGVPLKALRDFCAQFSRVGVGYYPKSGFVHLDVRKRNARWTGSGKGSDGADEPKGEDADESDQPEIEND